MTVEILIISGPKEENGYNNNCCLDCNGLDDFYNNLAVKEIDDIKLQVEFGKEKDEIIDVVYE